MEAATDTGGLLDVPEAARWAGITPGALYGLIHRRKVPAERIGGRCFVRSEHLEGVAAGAAARQRQGWLSPAYPVLMALGQHEGATAEELADSLSRSKRTVLGWLQDLDREGLVERKRDSAPREPARCSLTEVGWALYRRELAEAGTA